MDEFGITVQVLASNSPGIQAAEDVTTAVGASSVAAVARISEGICENIRIALGGVAPFPYVVPMAGKDIGGKKLDEGLISQAAEASVEGAKPLSMNG